MGADPPVVQIDIGNIIDAFENKIGPLALRFLKLKFGSVITGPFSIQPGWAAVVRNGYRFPFTPALQDVGEIVVVFRLIPELELLDCHLPPDQRRIRHMVF